MHSMDAHEHLYQTSLNSSLITYDFGIVVFELRPRLMMSSTLYIQAKPIAIIDYYFYIKLGSKHM